jgi:hypothetical protein
VKQTVKSHIKIMHIDPDYRVFLMVIGNGENTMSSLNLKEALALIRGRELDLILSEPQNMALFDKADSGNRPIRRVQRLSTREPLERELQSMRHV